jgi:tRNA threonylcarbamoyl adenosine modification protein YjeE
MTTVRSMPTFLLSNLQATRDFARRVAKDVAIGDVILLDGPLGTGKTTFTKMLVAVLNDGETAVTSPTFTLMHQYEGPTKVVHLDAYRLAGPADLDGLGFAEASDGAVALIEWGERVAAAFSSREGVWQIRLAHVEGDRRQAEIIPPARCRAAWAVDAQGNAAEKPIVEKNIIEQALESRPSLVSAPIVISADGNGRDPLTIAYIAKHRQTCAFKTLSWQWLVVTALLAVASGLVACRAHGVGNGLAWLGDPLAFLIGAAGAAVLVTGYGLWRRTRAVEQLPITQEAWMSALAVSVLYLVLYDPLIGVGIITGLLCTVYLGAIAFRLLALMLGGKRGLHTADLTMPATGWPMYTVLVPLYREVNVARNILVSLERLDYPRDKLDVKFLLEADDPSTRDALMSVFNAQGGIPAWAELLVVPHAQPKTKPRACNHGLARAKGEFLVIFDAEDRPETDQLKQAVLAFQRLPRRTACLQAQLAYHNHRQNLLTRWFAMEYNVWFRRYLPGLARLQVPIPLGGTSNHFRTEVLHELGGWDPFNVTEDCDLGVRLHLLGHRTELLESTTWEEANSVTGNWIRQRSRWLKGYFVTHVVWGRRPFWLANRLGPWAVWGFLLSVLFVPLLAATNLVLWIYATVYATLVSIDWYNGYPLWTLLAERDYANERSSWPMWFAGPLEDSFFGPASQVLFIASAVLLAGNAVFIVICGLAGRRPGQRGVWLPALLLPGYWFLISIAAWKGLWQAIVRPHYWEKTIHGLDKPHT